MNQLHDDEAADGWDIEHARIGVEGGALPVGPAAGAGNLNGSFQRCRCVQGAQAVGLHPLQGLGAQLRGEVDEILLRESLTLEGPGFSRKRLSRRRPFSRCVRAWYGPFFDGPYGLARLTVEYETEALLRDLHHRLDGFPLHGDVAQYGRGGFGFGRSLLTVPPVRR